MRTDRQGRSGRAWLFMLADVVALLLTFFALGLSMRDLDGGKPAVPRPMGAEPAAIALLTRGSATEHATPEISVEADRSFAYLAALLREQGGLATNAKIIYDDFQLVVDMSDPASAASPAERGVAMEHLATYAFLARRFALEASFLLPAASGEMLAARLDRAASFGRRLGRELGLDDAEVIVAAAGGPKDGRLRLALRTRPPETAGNGSIDPS